MGSNIVPAICMHRVDLHYILLSHNADIPLYQDHAFEDFTQLENGQVEVEFENGNRKLFDAVVGADGIHSKVREKIKGDGAPIFRGYNIWRGVCMIDFNMGYGSETYSTGKGWELYRSKMGILAGGLL